MNFNIMAIRINHRTNKAPGVQEILTRYGCIIRMRLGLHETGNVCSEEGLILLQLVGEPEKMAELEKELNAIDGVCTKTLSI